MSIEKLMQSNLLLIGAPYSGKTTYSKYLVKNYGYTHYSIGDYCRNRADTPTVYPSLIKEAYNTFDLTKKFVIDNAFKNEDQLGVLQILKRKKVQYEIVYFVSDIKYDLTLRKRADDYMLEKKLSDWEKAKDILFKCLDKLGETPHTVRSSIVYKIEN
jgi:adenylate kinase family enzyme